MLDNLTLGLEKFLTSSIGISIAKVALRQNADAQARALWEPKMIWVLKLTLGVMVSGNAADDD